MISAALVHYQDKLSTADLPIELESEKIKKQKASGKEPQLREEQIRALRQNLNNPGKVIIIADEENLPYPTTDLMIIADSSNNRYIIVDMLTMKCLDVIGNGRIGYKDGSYEEAEFYHT